MLGVRGCGLLIEQGPNTVYNINFNGLYDELRGRIYRGDEQRLNSLVGADGLYHTSNSRDVERIVAMHRTVHGRRTPSLDEYESGAFEV